jgi:ribosomal protein S18 acetylase RimI-like enzyme
MRMTRLTQIAASDRGDAADTHPGGDEGTDRADVAGKIPRLASLADLPAIRRVITDAYSRYLDRMNKPPAPVVTDYGPAISRGQVWVLGEPVIGVIVLTEEADGLLVENVAVSPAAQGAGNGRRLLEFAERQAILAGLRRLTLYTNEVMAENIALYGRLGYRETGRRFEDGYHRVFMAKLLAG